MTELQADTEAGSAMVAMADALAVELADGALANDRDGRFATDHLARLGAEGFLSAPVPKCFGGGDVSSVHDVLVASSRLARADPATAIGVNMHLAVVGNVVCGWRRAMAGGADGEAELLASFLEHIVAAGVVFATAVSEPPPQDLTRPVTTATRVGDGWRIDGRKIFATMAPHADLLNVAVTHVDEDGDERYAFAMVPTTSPGVEIPHDWDALGMRASESGSVTFTDVRVDALLGGFPAGVHGTALLDRYLTSGAFHAAATLGIAESAHAHATTSLRRRTADALADPHAVVRLAESVVDIASMRSVLGRAGSLIDRYLVTFPRGDAALEEVQAVYSEVQAAKTHINEASVRVVDRSLALAGGAGYMAGHPLAKAYRDVRAGGFMHPLGANRAYDFLARTALGAPLR